MTTQVILLMFFLIWITMFVGFFWGIRILCCLGDRIGDIKVDRAKQSAELAIINARLDRIAQLVQKDRSSEFEDINQRLDRIVEFVHPNRSK